MNVDEFSQFCERVGEITGESVLHACADDLENIVRMGVDDNFANEATADGSAWPKRKRQGDGHPILTDTGALRAGATEKGATGSVSRLGGETLEIGVDALQGGPGGLPGARVHNFGYPEKNIPQREYMAVSDSVVDFLEERTADEVMKVIG